MRSTIYLAALALLAALPGPAEARSGAVECQGLPATIVDLDGGEVDGTAGDDIIVVHNPNAIRTVSVNGLAGDDTICVSGYTWDGEDRSYVDAGAGADSLLLATSDNRDKISIIDVESVDARLGGGSDKGDSISFSGVVGAGTVVTGSGGEIHVVGSRAVVLRDDLLEVDDGPGGLSLEGFDRVNASAPRVDLRGDAGRDRLAGRACTLRLAGAGGRDHLYVAGSNYATPFVCERHVVRLKGGRGADRIFGSEYDDVLLGGPGRDRANGRAGDDRCRAETEVNCER